MKPYKYYLLDWDGNLAKTLHIWLVAFRTVLNNHGLEKTDKEVAELFGSFTPTLTEWGYDGRAMLTEAEDYVKDKLPEVELYPDALEVLEKLHAAGKKLALITTSPHRNVQGLLEKYEMTDFFPVIVAGDDVTHFKPHPEPLEKGLTALGGTKEAAVMIGDSDKDIGAANNFGIDSILFYPPEHEVFYDIETLRNLKPTHVIEDFKEILQTI